MNVYMLSAIEADVLARLCDKKKIFVIPDEFGELSAEEKKKAKACAIDSLNEKNLLVIDFDGNTFPTEDARRIAEFISECENTVVIKQEGILPSSEGLAVWQRSGKLLKAEQIGERFVFSELSKEALTEIWDSLISSLPTTSAVNGAFVEIPRLTMRKSRRWCFEEKNAEAIDLLRECGAPEDIATLLILGFLGHVNALFITYLSEENPPETISLLFDDRIIITINEKQGLDRGFFCVGEISSEDVACKLRKITELFERR